MSARRLPRSSKLDPEQANDSKTYEDRIRDPDLPDEVAMRILRTHLTWEEWLFRDFLRYWYLLGAFAFDIFLPWFVVDEFALRGGIAIGVVGSLVLTLIYSEFVLYLHLWPGGVWREGRKRKRKRFIPKGLR